MTDKRLDLSGAAIRGIPPTYRPAPSAHEAAGPVSFEPKHDWGNLEEFGAQVSVTIIDYARQPWPKRPSMPFWQWLRPWTRPKLTQDEKFRLKQFD
jgi:hypothetical protein